MACCMLSDGVSFNYDDTKGLTIGEKTHEPKAGDSPDRAIARAAEETPEGSDQGTLPPPHNLDISKTEHQPKHLDLSSPFDPSIQTACMPNSHTSNHSTYPSVYL
ncbi:MAG: hypothetical protein LQ345_002578 [Seirophora villosa]|nr:MAG: hypothetical protein LQ345_002578 [Seirophora villosa]